MSRRIVKEAPSPAPGIVSQIQPKKDGNGKEIFSHQLLSAMIAFRGGDFSVRLPANLTGLPGKLADTFNDIVEVSERRAGAKGHCQSGQSVCPSLHFDSCEARAGGPPSRSQYIGPGPPLSTGPDI